MNPNSSTNAPTREKASSLWFFTGFIAVFLAGVAKIAIANHFDPDAVDSE